MPNAEDTKRKSIQNLYARSTIPWKLACDKFEPREALYHKLLNNPDQNLSSLHSVRILTVLLMFITVFFTLAAICVMVIPDKEGSMIFGGYVIVKGSL